MKKNLLIATLLSVAATGSMAQSAFEGAYGQLGVGYDQNSVSSASGRANGVAVTYPSTNAGSFSGVVGLGYNFSVAKDFLLGIGADYGVVPSTKTNGTNTSGTLGSTISNRYNIFVTPGYALAKDKLAYLKAGYSSQNVKITEQTASTPATNGQTMGQGNANGYVLGLGYKQMVASGFYGFGEANYYSYSGAQFANTTMSDGTVTSAYSPKSSAYQFLVGVGYKF